MRSRVAAVSVLGSALVLPGCGDQQWANTPVCDEPTSALILSAQAMPGTAFVPCIHSLKTDWVYDELRAKTGEATFGLDSLMGTEFLRVTLQPACDTSGARRVTSDEPAPLYLDVEDDDQVRVTVVTDGQGREVSAYASEIVGDLDGSVVGDRVMVVELDARGTAVTSRIDEAHRSGAVVLVATVRDSEQRTVTVLLPDEDTERNGVPVDDLVETLRGIAGPATYTGSWYYPFANGCVVYAFNAQGSGVATLETDVKAALGLYDAEAMRQQARDLGFDVR